MEDKWIAIKDNEVVGIYETKEEALKHGDCVLSPLTPITQIPDDGGRMITMKEYAALWRYKGNK